jgi:carboxypeptidase Q
LKAGTAGIAYDPNYHQAGDNYTNLNFEAFLVNTKAIAAAVAEYGASFDSLPAANTTSTKLKRRSAEQAKQKRRTTNKRSCGHKPTW